MRSGSVSALELLALLALTVGSAHFLYYVRTQHTQLVEKTMSEKQQEDMWACLMKHKSPLLGAMPMFCYPSAIRDHWTTVIVNSMGYLLILPVGGFVGICVSVGSMLSADHQ